MPGAPLLVTTTSSCPSWLKSPFAAPIGLGLAAKVRAAGPKETFAHGNPELFRKMATSLPLWITEATSIRPSPLKSPTAS